MRCLVSFAPWLPCCVLQGVTRRVEWCKQRHSAIMKAGESATEQGAMLGPDGQPLDAAAAGNTASLASLTKQQVGCENSRVAGI